MFGVFILLSNSLIVPMLCVGMQFVTHCVTEAQSASIIKVPTPERGNYNCI